MTWFKVWRFENKQTKRQLEGRVVFMVLSDKLCHHPENEPAILFFVYIIVNILLWIHNHVFVLIYETVSL